MLGHAKIHGGLHQHLDGRQAAPEDELSERIASVLFEQAADQCVHERAVRAPDAGEIQHHLFAMRNAQIRVDPRHAECVRVGSIAETGAEIVHQPHFVCHGWKLAGFGDARKGISISLAMCNL